jgi:outer membrane protein OmpA-like peptidoglycan-associated protein
MRNVLIFSLLAGLAGCANMANPFSSTPPTPSTPATPVFFQEWSSALDASALTAISQAAKVANAEPGTKVIVTGAADTLGSAQANKYLSETRAQVVADQLVADGVEASRIKTRSVGETAAPGVASGMPAQFSRRVTIAIE